MAPRGRPELDRLGALTQAIEHLLGSPWLAHAEADEIEQLIEQGLATVTEVIATLTPTVDDWEAEVLDAASASDGSNFRRADGVAGSARDSDRRAASQARRQQSGRVRLDAVDPGVSAGAAAEDEAETPEA